MTRGWRDALVLPVLLAVLAAPAGCGSGVLDAGDDEAASTTTGSTTSTSTTSTSTSTTSTSTTTTSTSTSTTGKPTTTTEEGWEWGLPSGDPSPAGEGTSEVEVYRALKEGCSRGQAELDQRWDRLRSPLTVLVFQAAVHACSRDRESARRMLERAGGDHSGVASSARLCTAYRTLRSVLDQVSPDSVTCPGGAIVRWPPRPDPSAPRDDPRTDGDETTTTATGATGTASTTTSGG